MGSRIGNKTTPSPSWKLGFHNHSFSNNNNNLSARKIAANLWELQQPQFLFNFNSNKDDAIRRRHRTYDKDLVSDHQHHHVIPDMKYTSRHLVKIVNRIWNLEEEHSRNQVLIKSLKRDVDISRAQIKTLLEEKKIREERERDEKKEYSGLKREKKARILLESLCDEFAKGMIKQKVTCLQDQSVSIRRRNDQLLLHVSEVWLDERSQMKGRSSSSIISDKLCCEIETFLKERKKQGSGSRSRMSEEEEHGAKVNTDTLMAKLVEARLESQFSKSTKNKKR